MALKGDKMRRKLVDSNGTMTDGRNPVEEAKKILQDSRDKKKQDFIKRFAEFCQELEANGYRLFTQQVIVDGTLGNVMIGITERV